MLASNFVIANELLPAGSGSTSDQSVNAFSHPLAGTPSSLRREFVTGNSFFKTVWVQSPASTTIRDGLGPTYNATSCTSCHLRDGRGRGLPEVDGYTDTSLLMRLRRSTDQGVLVHPNYGGQFNPFGISGVPGEGRSFVRFQDIQGQYEDLEIYTLRRPNYYFEDLSFGEFDELDIISPRVGPQMIGLGLLEAISEADILKNSDPLDLDFDEISGRANIVTSLVTGKKTLGRFGWKAGKASLLEQNSAAFNGDIGITSSLFPKDDCPIIQIDCQIHSTENDISDEILDRVTTYTQLLSVPVRRNVDDLDVIRGQRIFSEISCQKCHIPSFTTSREAKFEVLRNQKIYPYTDLLLHDMGELLSDSKMMLKNEEEALTSEWRTPALWGIGLIPTVNGHSRLLHDGRARNVEEAILWHGGEALNAKNRFLKLSKNERNQLIKFVNSL